jgi:Domain of unknown function (DUF4124)
LTALSSRTAANLVLDSTPEPDMLSRPSMLLGLALAGVLATTPAMAQGIHRSVGPDGRVVFSDMPPPGPARTAAAPAAEGRAAQREQPPLDPALDRAITTVLSMEDLVEQTESICLKARPTAMSRYLAATDGWRKRNGTLASQAHRALEQPYGEAASRAVRDAVKARNERTLSPVNGAAAAARMAWCDRSMDEVVAGKLDIFDKPQLSGPLGQAGTVGGAKRAAR